MRQTYKFNKNWSFSKDGVHFAPVTLPHTWNAVDGMDGKGSYDRGCYTYKKELITPLLKEGERVCLEILAASLSSKVFVNGIPVKSHEGGFSSFVADITDFLHYESPQSSNEITIAVDNSPNSRIYPQMADFTFYGGLYRGINLLILPEVHFDMDYHGACGLAVTPELLPSQQAILHLNSWLTQTSPDYTVCYSILDAEGRTVAESVRPSEDTKSDLLLPQPHLWQGTEDPYLYLCTASLIYRNEVVDSVSTRFGVRSFHVDPAQGFFLNGKPYPLRGVSRHQDRLYKGNALTREEHYEDAALIHELGANTVRLAHYQHSRDFYDACDEYGFIVWAEIPYISCQSDDPAAFENCELQLKDLIYQNYNHPSICFWGISNEITIAGEKPGLVENHKKLHQLAKEADPSRLTTIAHVTMLPMDSPLHKITDLESYNHYFGWYGGKYEDTERWLDKFHALHPDICLGLSEYGAEGILTYQPDTPACRDYSEAYQALYHEHLVKILMERPYIWSSYVWNMFDFGCAARNEGGTAGRNNKGLMTMDRRIKKEAFYVYKSYWSKEPFVYLCGRRYSQRAGDTTTVKVYSNLQQVTLSVNGKPFASLHGHHTFVFEQVPLEKDGFTFLTAEAADGEGTVYTDSITLEKVDSKPAIYTLPKEESEGEGVANWFSQIETVASDSPIEFSNTHFSVCDTVSAIMDNDNAFEILSNAMYSMTGMRLNKSMLAMMGGKTLLELTDMMQSFSGSSENKIPENALQIINAELNKISKQSAQ